jgi:hypothetical protein
MQQRKQQLLSTLQNALHTHTTHMQITYLPIIVHIAFVDHCGVHRLQSCQARHFRLIVCVTAAHIVERKDLTRHQQLSKKKRERVYESISITKHTHTHTHTHTCARTCTNTCTQYLAAAHTCDVVVEFLIEPLRPVLLLPCDHSGKVFYGGTLVFVAVDVHLHAHGYTHKYKNMHCIDMDAGQGRRYTTHTHTHTHVLAVPSHWSLPASNESPYAC